MADFNCKRCMKVCHKEIKAQRILLGKCEEFHPFSKEKTQLMEDIYKDIEQIDYLDDKEKQELKIKFLLETDKRLKL